MTRRSGIASSVARSVAAAAPTTEARRDVDMTGIVTRIVQIEHSTDASHIDEGASTSARFDYSGYGRRYQLRRAADTQRDRRPRFKMYIILAIAGLIAAPATGATLVSQASFAVAGLNVWGPGNALAPDEINNRVGPSPIHFDHDYKASYCLLACASAQVGARLDADFGLDYYAKINSGSFDARYPIKVEINTPYQAPVAGQAFTIHTAYSVGGFATAAGSQPLDQVAQLVNNTLSYLVAQHSPDASPSQPVVAGLQVHSPTIDAHVDLHAMFDAFLGASVCLAGECYTPVGVGPYMIDKSQMPLLGINPTGATAFGKSYAFGADFTDPSGFINGSIGLPNVDAQAHLHNGTSTANNLVSVGRSTIAAVHADVSGLIGQAIAIPLNGNVGPFDYHLLDANAGLALDLRQTASLAVVPMEKFDFTDPVEQRQADGTWGAATRELIIPLGSDLTLRSNSGSLGILPTTMLDARLTNTTDLVVAGDIHIKALSVVLNLPDPLPNISIGPAYDSGSVSFDLVPIPLFQRTFDVDFGQSIGVPFNIGQDYIINAVSPGKRLLDLVAGAVPGRQSLYNTSIVAIDQSQSGCRLYDRLNPCRPVFFADGAPVAVDANNEVTVLSNTDALSLPAIIAAPVGSDALELQTLLATGFNSQVPEPANWVLLVAGFGITGGTMRRQRGVLVT